MDELTVAIQGEAGAFSHAAALELLGPKTTVVPARTFDDLFAAVTSGRVDRALVPVENTLAGSVHENYDRLRALPVHIVGETRMRIRHCLIVRPGARLASLARVASHPVALAQCRTFFQSHPAIEAVAAYDTAGSVADLLRDGPTTQGAIASRLAATLYGGEVLLEGIEDDPQNYTRFLLLAREPARLEGTGKGSLVLTLENEPGALHRALGVFAARGVDLAKIESRPLRGRPWEYAFYLDVMGEPGGPAGDAIGELQTFARELRVLGWYPVRPDPIEKERA